MVWRTGRTLGALCSAYPVPMCSTWIVRPKLPTGVKTPFMQWIEVALERQSRDLSRYLPGILIRPALMRNWLAHGLHLATKSRPPHTTFRRFIFSLYRTKGRMQPIFTWRCEARFLRFAATTRRQLHLNGHR